ncbi:haloacid dehalogenase superfamily, subfamily IA, variant 3 with third motif having DD or ED/haloacid dehalogenase superfamily, subfamily IA, variant 1 with third motif having Dx(3-4)D or Dx(3-4)E [Epilithonimonas bovis DSM 19482]|uniref:Haloacid dehalogenase superfamily, subfamily IA, variant 3 with third motif having DD or ED/haloacid dehalogenase superfamily, subfamily IA, variant 1 with third motif having Dx(3-4)D or Dx(3-4)E n=1 Tax=Epilithonimonas bovis DSM 19482 TaxID=1121284 RepID=A0A1U7PXT3_9FLAO|nr:HAD-IA family hydrolase [Epilithonimonas bovis]SIT96578.1 haloacid dehalogenase superfamily, subfamily IA, variant 3 with third motif having DD or ED/haloacid dehalogenase superfamily, subfamily IA, variant 1 with third motif having Dx(3-4)D or Dx(3-4)E [Epilithonimonas bovis DSM 19482]
MKNTVIFDMDGVIVDTEPLHKKAYYQHFGELGIEVDAELFSRFTGKSTRNVYQMIKEIFKIGTDVEALIQRKRTIFYGLFDSDPALQLLDGVEDLVKNLHSANFQLILASSAAKSTINRVFKRFDLFPYFSYLVSGEDFPESKPNPAIFIEAQRLSGNVKTSCIIIEDSTNGILAANRADIFCVGYKSANSKNQNYELADMVIQHFDELDPTRIADL